MFNRPSLADMINRVTQDVFQRMQTDTVLRRMDAQVYARVLAGVAHGLYGFIEWVSQQIIIDTAEREFLERWASLWGVQRLAATAATGTATFSLQPGAADIPSGTLLQTLDGTQFQTSADVQITGTTGISPLIAVVAAAIGNHDSGQRAQLLTPILGVNPSATLSVLSGGADLESDDSLRARLLNRIQQPPQGGNANDYVQWTLQAPDGHATRAWVTPLIQGPGTVGVQFVCDGNGAGVAIIPNSSQLLSVQSYLATVRPVTANVMVSPPVPVLINFILGGLTPNTAQEQAAVAAELADLITREGQPGGILLLSHIRSSISAAAGEWDYDLILPNSNVVMGIGQIPVMGSISWQPV